MAVPVDISNRPAGPAVVRLPEVREALAHLLPRVGVIADEPVVEEGQLHPGVTLVGGVIQLDQADDLIERKRRVDHVPLAALSGADGVAVDDAIPGEHDGWTAGREWSRRDRDLGNVVVAPAM